MCNNNGELEYSYRIYTPCWWLTMADRLRHAASTLMEVHNVAALRLGEGGAHAGPDREQLREDLDLRDPALMLYGLAFENLIKGCKAANSKDVWGKPLSTLPPDFKDHNLDNLILETGIHTRLSAEDMMVLKTLSEYVEWKGRYSAPTRAGISNSHGRSVLQDPPGESWPTKAVLEELFDRLLNHFWELMP